VIAIVEDGAEAGVKIGTAAPARLSGRFVDCNLTPLLCQPHRSRQPRQPRANDVRNWRVLLHGRRTLLHARGAVFLARRRLREVKIHR